MMRKKNEMARLKEGDNKKTRIVAKAMQNKPPAVIEQELWAEGMKTSIGYINRVLTEERGKHPDIPYFNTSSSKAQNSAEPARTKDLPTAAAQYRVIRKTLRGDSMADVLDARETVKLGPRMVIETYKLVEPYKGQHDLLEKAKAKGYVSPNANSLPDAFAEILRMIEAKHLELAEIVRQKSLSDQENQRLFLEKRKIKTEKDQAVQDAIVAQHSSSILARLVKEHGLYGANKLIAQAKNWPAKKREIEFRELVLRTRESKLVKGERNFQQNKEKWIHEAVKREARIREQEEKYSTETRMGRKALLSNPELHAKVIEEHDEQFLEELVKGLSIDGRKKFREVMNRVEEGLDLESEREFQQLVERISDEADIALASLSRRID